MFMPKINAAGTAWMPQAWDTDKIAGAVTRFISATVANAAAIATIPGVVGQTAYVTGFEVWAGGATVAALVSVTLAGVLGGSQTFPFSAVAGVALVSQPLVFSFDGPALASAANVTLALPALGLGNASAQVVLRGGYQ